MKTRCLHANSGCTNEPAEDRTLCERCVSEVVVTRGDPYHERLREQGKTTVQKSTKRKRTE